MVTKKQLLISISLAVMSKVVLTAPANAFPDNIGAQIFSAPPSFSGSTGGGSSTGGISTGGEGLTGGIVIPPGMSVPSAASPGTSSGGSSSGVTGDSGNSSTGIVTVADIANYFTNSIDRSLDELDTSQVAQRPRRIVRRRSSASCPNPQISRSSESLDDLLSQSEQFIEQLNQLKPENSIW